MARGSVRHRLQARDPSVTGWPLLPRGWGCGPCGRRHRRGWKCRPSDRL